MNNEDEPDYVSPITSFRYPGVNAYSILPNPSVPPASGYMPERARNSWTRLVALSSQGGAVAAASARKMLAHFQANKFIDLRTRFLVIDANIYNPNLDYAVVVTVALEFPVGGGVVPWSRFSTVAMG